ncbi:MAG: polysaccharide biosynthesis/export family protein [Pseudomonadota bacterium]
MPRLIVCLFAIFGALLVGPAAAQGAYLLKPGDQVEITVLEDPSLNRQVLVLPDGSISLPIAGTVQAAGLSPDQLATRVQRGFASAFVAPPTVTASVFGIASEALAEEDEETPEVIYVLGEVQRPGVFAYEDPLTILQALALAGGPAQFAARDRIQIRRVGEDGGETLEIFDYDALEAGTAFVVPRAVLGDGDVVLVPERGLFD